jgi:hypothetical protein
MKNGWRMLIAVYNNSAGHFLNSCISPCPILACFLFCPHVTRTWLYMCFPADHNTSIKFLKYGQGR